MSKTLKLICFSQIIFMDQNNYFPKDKAKSMYYKDHILNPNI